MNAHNKPLIYFCAIIVLLLTQIACVLGEVMDANPAGNNPNYAGTLAAEQTEQNKQSATTTSPVVTTTSTSVEKNPIEGTWQGTAQWLCDNNPVWTLSMSFQANGTVSATLTNQNEIFTSQGSWILEGNEIRIQFSTNFWYGTYSENSIDGFFEEDDCNGVWSIKK